MRRVDCVGEDVGEKKRRRRREHQAMIAGQFGVWKKRFECGSGQRRAVEDGNCMSSTA